MGMPIDFSSCAKSQLNWCAKLNGRFVDAFANISTVRCLIQRARWYNKPFKPLVRLVLFDPARDASL